MFYAAFAILLVIVFGHVAPDTERALVCLMGLVLLVAVMRFGSQ
jgi:hypothetical protein